MTARYFKNLVLAIVLLPTIVTAQYTSLSDKLTEISNKMYQEGNEYFILVDAIKDGIINANEHYNFSYAKGDITFNQQQVDRSLRRAYEKKMTQFLEANGSGSGTMLSLRGDGIKMDDILNAKSSMRKGVGTMAYHKVKLQEHEGLLKEHEKALEEHNKALAKHEKIVKEMEVVTKKNIEIGKKQTAYTDKIIAAMVKDGLVSKKKPMHIQWNLKGIFVNDKKLTGAMAQKYNKMFEQEVGYQLKQPDDGVEITKN
jgi:arsenate reductase-like glutaredoxin family protein